MSQSHLSRHSKTSPNLDRRPDPLVLSEIEKIASTMRNVDFAYLVGSILQEIGMPNPETWLGTSELGDLIQDRVFDDHKIRPRYIHVIRELRSVLGYRPPIGLLSACCRIAAIDLFNEFALSDFGC